MNTTNELIQAATECLRNGDFMLLDQCQQTLDGWMLDDEERSTLQNLLDAVNDAIDNL